MAKLKKQFQFQYEMKQKVVRDLKIVTETIGTLDVEGTAYEDTSVSMLDICERYSVDIDSIKWEGTDITPVLEFVGAIDEIVEFCIRKSTELFMQTERRTA